MLTASAPSLTVRALKYGVAGLVGTAIYYAAVAALVESAGMAPVPASAVATIVVIVVSYAINRQWVFDTTLSHAAAFTRFVMASMLSLGINTGLMWLAVRALGWSYAAGLVMATIVVPPTNFVVNYLWCFRRETGLET